MNALDVARKMETDAIRFYSEAARKVSCATGRKMFEAIVEDEKNHLVIIDRIAKGMNLTPQEMTPLKRVKTVFASMKDEMMKKAASCADDLEALKIAMQMEKEGESFYKKSLDAATTDKEQALFQRLIDEERQHYAIFSNTYSHLSDTGNWFLWEERGIVEGG